MMKTNTMHDQIGQYERFFCIFVCSCPLKGRELNVAIACESPTVPAKIVSRNRELQSSPPIKRTGKGCRARQALIVAHSWL